MANTLTQTKYRRGTEFSVSFPTFPALNIMPRRVDLFQKQYSHDVLVLEYIATSPLWFDNLATGVPVLFSWTQGSHTETWPGYVSHTTKVVASQKNNTMEVHCVSSSYPLKERATRVFTDVTIPEAVAQICKEFGFNFVGEQHPRRFEQLTMAGHSYWEFLQEQAKRIGYGMAIVGTDLLFRPLDKLIDQGGQNIPIMSLQNNDQVVKSKFLDKTLDYFKVLKGDYLEGEQNRSTKEVSGVDPFTNKKVTSMSSPKEIGVAVRSTFSDVLFAEQRSEQVVHTRSDASNTSDGLAQHGRFNMPAKVKGQGDPRIKPFFPVFISGTGESTDGYWIAKEVHHMFHKIGDYQLEMTVTSDGTGITNYTAYRTEPNSIIGVVNLTEAIKSLDIEATTNNVAAHNNRFYLTSVVPVILENAQGYNRTKARWKSPTNVQGSVR